MAFDIDIGFVTEAGRKPVNEDFCAALLPDPAQASMGCIVAIADGVSTGGMGREAAQTTVTSLVRDYYGTPETWDTTVALDRIIAAQNTWLAGINRRRQPVMGLTTLTALVLRGQTYTLAHVGDTRAYLLRDGVAIQLSHDHVVQHPDFRHQLLRSVGAENHVVVDYMQGDLQVGDVFVLVSDGAYGNVRSEVFERRLLDCTKATDTPSAQDFAQKLVAAAHADGTNDNVTAMVVQVRGLQDATLQDAQRLAHSLPIPTRLKVGDALDGLVVTAPIADNGVNVLYQVRGPQQGSTPGKLYALKTLSPARAHDAQERAMLAHEAWLALHMQSCNGAEHLVRVHQDLPHQPPRSAFYVLYDWHSGATLQQQLDSSGKLGVASTLALMRQAVHAVGCLHRQCVIHRDIKPANLHVGDDGVLRVLDLGVALTGREPEALRRLHAGTASYVNPEQWGFQAQGEASDAAQELPTAQSDLFALGVTLYQLLTGKLPYGEVLPYQVGRYYRDPTPPSRHNPEVPIWLDHVLLKAVARDKRQRFETAEEFLLALERGASRPLYVQGTPLLQRDPTTLWKLALGVSVLLNALLIYWLLFLPK